MPASHITIFDGSKNVKHDVSSIHSEIHLVVDGVIYRITPQNNSISIEPYSADYPGLSVHPVSGGKVLIKAEESTSSILRKKARKLEQEQQGD